MKSDFYIEKVERKEVEHLLLTYHYLKDHSKTFRSGHHYALFKGDPDCVLRPVGTCVGAIVFTGIPVPEIAVSAFGLAREDQDGLFELSRLCIHPDVQAEEYNITSWFVSFFLALCNKFISFCNTSSFFSTCSNQNNNKSF